MSALGCRLNEAELELWSQQFQVAGFDISTNPQEADLLVFTSCAVTQEAVRKSRQQINRLKRNNPDAKVVVSGCFVSLNEHSAPSQPTVKSNPAVNSNPAANTTVASEATASTYPRITSPLNHPGEVDLVVPNAQKDELVPLIVNEWYGDLTGHVLPQNAESTPPSIDQTAADESIQQPGVGSETATSVNRIENGLKSEDLTQSRKFPIIPILSSRNPGSAVSSNAEPQPTFTRQRQRAFIKIQDGCRYKCTYCIVTVARGEERSRSIQELVSEVRQLHEQGIKEIVLTGVHVGGYGSDTGESLASLLEALLHDTAIQRIRFASVEPWDLEDHLLTVLQHPRVMPHMHLPVQSGCNSVLQRMARRCKTSDFQSLVNRLRQSMPDFNVTTDIIVGFPGETDDEWQDTLRFVENTSFGHIHIFPFSPRQGTHAAKLDKQVEGAVRKQRAQQLKQLADSGREEFLSRFTGRTMDVLWESAKPLGNSRPGNPEKKPNSNQNPETDAPALAGQGIPDLQRYLGYTPNYIRVFCDSDISTPSLENRILPTQLNAVSLVTGGSANSMLCGTIK